MTTSRTVLKIMPKKCARLPKVRESNLIVNALTKECSVARSSRSEAIRQILTTFLTNPQPIQDEPGALPLDGYLAPVRLDALLLDRIQAHAKREGVGVGVVVRQAVRVHLGRAE